MTLFAFSAISYSVGGSELSTLHFALWGSMISLLLLRALDAFYWRLKIKNAPIDSDWPLFRFSIGAIATAFIWALFSVSFYDKMDLFSLSFIMIALAATSSAASTLLAPSLPLVLFYCTIMIVPLSLRAIIDTDANYNLLGNLGIVYWIAVCALSKQTNTYTNNAIAIKHENDKLLNQLREDRNQVANINETLVATNHKLDISNNTLEREVKRRTADLRKMVNRDPLTGLKNRIGFVQHLEQLMEQAKASNFNIAVMYVDLDGFKQVNDSLGHQAGDRVLIEVSKKLSKYCEANSIGRWSGDEFILLVSYADYESAQTIAQAAKNSLKIMTPVNGSEIHIDATIGIAFYPEHSNDASTLVQLADLTMYNQKHTAPGNVGTYSDALYAKHQYEQQLRDGLNQAVDKKQLHVVYQPILAANCQSLWAVEALLRWEFNGMWISPIEFIPLAEKAGIINELGNWILHRACIDAASWHDDSLKVSVNVSVLQLMNKNFVNQVEQALKSSGLAPQRLHLEVTESIFADDIELLTQQISALKARKIKIAIDDFGTGFSSLNLLQTLEFDLIKIDRSFVAKLTKGSDAIVRATLLIAKEFNCITVAEGIETQEQAKLLKEMGVDNFQGYLYARPLDKNQLHEWYAKEYDS